MKKIYNHLHFPPGKRRRISLTAKLALVLLVCVGGSLHATALEAQQTALTVSWSNEAIVRILDYLKSETGYQFFYRKGLIPEDQKATVAMNDATLDEVLDGVLVRNGYSYDIQDKVVLINRGARSTRETQQPRTITVAGRVTNDKGAVIAGASVMVDGVVSNGTTTDVDGRFSLTVPAGSTSLTVSFVGYKTRTARIGEQRELNVILEESVHEIDDVVVTGYNTIDKALNAGSVFQFKPDEVLASGYGSIEEGLQGIVPGMTVINQSGLVGAKPKVRIRGTSTLFGNQEPLWVVDGVIQRDPLPLPDATTGLGENDVDELREVAASAISWLNPMDIESITVLKDAASTAIYGTQASNGVIVITTKKARAGDVAVSYSGSFTIGQKPTYDKYDMMNSQQLMQFQQEMYQDRNTWAGELLRYGWADLVYRMQIKDPTLTPEVYEREFRKLEMQNTDWFDVLFRNQLSHIHNISVSGGSEQLTNRTSVGLQNILGEARGNDMRNFSVSSTSTLRISDRLIANLTVNGSLSERNGYAFGVDPFDYAMRTSRTTPIYNEDGSPFYIEKWGALSTAIPGKRSYLFNVLNEIENSGNEHKTQKLQTTFDLDYKITDGLSLRGMFAYAMTNSTIRSYATEYTNYIANIRGYELGEEKTNNQARLGSRLPVGGVSVNENATNNDWSTRADLNYNRVFGDHHTLLLQLGAEMRSGRTKGHKDTRFGYNHYRGEKYVSIPLAPVDIPGAPRHSEVTNLHEAMRLGTANNNALNNYVSGYFTAIYSYDRRYTVNLNARTDASNRFGQDRNKRFQPNWSAGFKWRLAEEPFFNRTWWLDMVDLSFTYGYRGNAVESVSPYLIAVDGGYDTYYKQPMLNIKSLPYPDLGWEQTNDWNAGIDVSLFGGRLSITNNFFAKFSDVLNFRNIPLENGMESAVVMGQKIESRGWDIFVNVIPVRTNDFTWSLTFNTGYTSSVLKDSEQINDRDMYISGEAIVTDEPYSTFWSYSYAGLNPANGYPTFDYMDIDPTMNPLDFLVKSGKLEPDFQGGVSTVLRYKDLSVRTQFAMSFGAHGRLPFIYNEYGAPTPDENVPLFMQDRWRKPGDESRPGVMPAIPTGNRDAGALRQLLPAMDLMGRTQQSVNRFTMWHMSDARVASSDFIRCRNLSVSWEVPTKFIDDVADRMSLSFTMTNPFLITFDKKWDGYDPETGNWPLRRTMTLNLSLAF